MATYAIGDVQGCVDALLELLDAVGFNRKRDCVWFVGDLVNRGPDSLATLRLVKELGDAAVAVLGNHDFHLLAVAAGHAKLQRSDTLDAVLDAPDCEELLAWLRHRPMMHVQGKWAMVHAGLLPQWNIARAQVLAREVEAALRGEEWRDFMATLYGNKPDCWSENLRGADRLRVIVNAMARMRFCTADGRIEFHTKGEAGTAPPGFFPWFDVPGRVRHDHTIVCGHWSALGLKLRPDLLALDSGCVWGGSLSAVQLEDGSLFQVPCDQCQVPAV
jgi:bis(5'-nucleosyl)-tetraphosphatase (symmetrical)